MKKSKITHEAQFVDWEYIRRKNNVIFNEVLAECEEKRIRHLMDFKHGWNKEIIAQFYATIFFGYHESERAMFWMTEEQKYHITFSEFVFFSALETLTWNILSSMMLV